MKTIIFLGTRGIPARHGGFETFVERLALYLKTRGWKVIVYCQSIGALENRHTTWSGIKLISIKTKSDSALSTLIFDLKAIIHASRHEGLFYICGYNTAIFSLWPLLKGKYTIMNMDGIEWRRRKWNLFFKAWLFLNEWIGSKLSDHLIADHPEIAKHLYRHTRKDKISIIAYGADSTATKKVAYPKEYYPKPILNGLVVARLEPENSILELIQAWGMGTKLGTLFIVGSLSPQNNVYHDLLVKESTKLETRINFLGAIYDQEVLLRLRRHAGIYLHGHQCGGTNPSLVEAMSAGAPIIAHDNVFNRWVLGECGLFFDTVSSLANLLSEIECGVCKTSNLAKLTLNRFEQFFNWTKLLHDNETLLNKIIRIDE